MSTRPDSSFSECEKAAMSYAWQYFSLHATQRQTVFNFFLILLGGAVAGYASTLNESAREYLIFRLIIGGVLIVASLLFWRLDERNSRLVKIAEGALGAIEKMFSERLSTESFSILKIADHKVSKSIFSRIETFGQIYRSIFLLTGMLGASLVIHSTYKLQWWSFCGH